MYFNSSWELVSWKWPSTLKWQLRREELCTHFLKRKNNFFLIHQSLIYMTKRSILPAEKHTYLWLQWVTRHVKEWKKPITSYCPPWHIFFRFKILLMFRPMSSSSKLEYSVTSNMTLASVFPVSIFDFALFSLLFKFHCFFLSDTVFSVN